jgi:hypothetical protein
MAKKIKDRAQVVAQIDAELAERMRLTCEKLGTMQRVFIERAIESYLDSAEVTGQIAALSPKRRSASA